MAQLVCVMVGEVVATFHADYLRTMYCIDAMQLMWWYDIARHRNHGISLTPVVPESEKLQRIAENFTWDEKKQRYV